jgi:glyoxylase-like metal-dependent hydrolase (beta-lactamase superfamily II)
VRCEASRCDFLRIERHPLFLIECFPSGPLANNTYVLVSAGEAVVIDPGPSCEKEVCSFLSEELLSLKAIWITHSHLDHFAGCKKLVDTFHVPVAISALDAPNLEQPGKDKIDLWIKCEAVTPTFLLRDKDSLSCGESIWTVIHTPGHSPGSCCFYNAEENALFSGDTLFRGTYGRCDFPFSDSHLMAESLHKLSLLPEETVVYPGHGPSTTIGREKSWMIKIQEK